MDIRAIGGRKRMGTPRLSKCLRPETTGAEKPIVYEGHSHRGGCVLDAGPIKCGLRDRMRAGEMEPHPSARIAHCSTAHLDHAPAVTGHATGRATEIHSDGPFVN